MKRVQSFILILALVLTMFSGLGITAHAADSFDYTGYVDYSGQTTVGNYKISTAAQLAQLAYQTNNTPSAITYAGSKFVLTADINLATTDSALGLNWAGGTEWTPIAKYSEQAKNSYTGYRFQGTFDGNGHYVKNIKISKKTSWYEGYSLFGAVGTSGVVQNLGVTGTVAVFRCAGGIAGYNFGKISHCFSDVTVTEDSAGGTRAAGGIAGHNEGTVEYCINAGTVYNTNIAGGIVGYIYSISPDVAIVDHCINVATVTSAAITSAGAIVGSNGQNAASAGNVTNCYYLTGSAVRVLAADYSTTSAGVTAFNKYGMVLDGSGNQTSNTLKSALNDPTAAFIDAASGAYPVLSWQSGYTWASQTYTAGFSVSPSTATVVVKDSGNVTMTQTSANTYKLPDGNYSYTVSASGYTSSTGAITVAGSSKTTAVTLTPVSSGGSTYTITGYSDTHGTVTSSVANASAGDTVTLTVAPASNYFLTGLTLSHGTLNESVSATKSSYTFVMPSSDVTVTAAFEPVALTIKVQSSGSGTPAVGAVYSRSQLEALATTKASPKTGYIYYKNNTWMAVVATKYIPLDSLLADAGISFGSADSITARSGDDGFYDTVSYKVIQDDQYYFDPNNSGASTLAPYIIALEHYSGTLSPGGSLSSILSGSVTTTLRDCYGCTEKQYLTQTAYGSRMVSSMTTLTVIHGAEVNENTKKHDETASTSDIKVTVAAKVNVVNGAATANINSSDITKALGTVNTAGGKSVVEISAVSGKDVKKAEVVFPENSMESLSKNKLVNGLKLFTDEGDIVMDRASLEGVASEMKGNAVTVSIQQPEKTALTAEQQALVGSNAVYALSISAADKKITDFDGKVTVSLPYKLAEGEDASNVVIYHLSSDGKIEKFKATYDSGTGKVTFTTDHFSVYMIAYEPTAAYEDVALGNWYYDAVNNAIKKGLMSGTSATKFEPGANTTRAMLATILWRLAGEEKPTLAMSPFADVSDQNAWYYNAALWAYEKGIIKGLNDTTFGATKALSRQELVTMLYRYSQLYNSSLTAAGTMDTSHFADWSTVPDWASEGFQWGIQNGVISGTSDSMLSPGSNATRSQLASILMRYK